MHSNRMGASLEIKTNLPGGEHKVVHVPVDESQNRVHVHLSRIETMIKHVLVEAEILRKSDDHQQPPSEVVNCVVEPTAAEGGGERWSPSASGGDHSSDDCRRTGGLALHRCRQSGRA